MNNYALCIQKVSWRKVCLICGEQKRWSQRLLGSGGEQVALEMEGMASKEIIGVIMFGMGQDKLLGVCMCD